MDIQLAQAVVDRTSVLSHYEITVLFALSMSVPNHDTLPSPSYGWIADKMNMSTGSISKAINRLQKIGVIAKVSKRRTNNGHFSNVYHVDLERLSSGCVKKMKRSDKGSCGEASSVGESVHPVATIIKSNKIDNSSNNTSNNYNSHYHPIGKI